MDGSNPAHSAVASASKREEDRASYGLLEGEQETHTDIQDAAWHTANAQKGVTSYAWEVIGPKATPSSHLLPYSSRAVCVCVELEEPRTQSPMEQKR